MDEHRAESDQLLVELRQHLQKVRPLLAVPQDPGLVVQGPAVRGQGGGIPGPQLAQRRVHELPPGGGPLPDQKQIVGAEEHRVIHLAQGGGVFGCYLVDGELSPLSPVQLRPDPEFPLPGQDAGLQQGRGGVEGDHLPVRSGPGGFSTGEVDNGLQQVGLALGVLPEDHVAVRVEVHQRLPIVAKIPQLQALKPHRPPYSVRPGSTRRLPGGSSCPAWCTPRRSP